MKVLTTLFLVGCLQSMAAGYAQKVTLLEKEARIEKVFKEIRKQTGYQFLYTTKMVENAKKVTIDVKDAPLEDALSRCFQEQPFTYEIKDKTIIIKSRSVPQPLPTKPDPPIDVKGRLTNEKGEPVAGASVSVKGTLTRVLTNANGEFSLMGVEENAILYVSHVQYEDATIEVNGNLQIYAKLETRVSSLDETQVIAYGTVTKRLNSGNVYSVKARDLGKQPVNNPLQAIQGRVPGVMITQETGVTGGGYKVTVRGRNSIANGTDPLYIIDGVPYTSQVIPSSGNIASYTAIGSTFPSPLNFINTADIESIEVLKDADATAIYGTRAANGVIMITTKKGKAGKSSFDFNVYSGVAQMKSNLKMLNRQQYLQYRLEAFKNDGATPGPGLEHDVNGDWDSTRYTDWQDELFGGNAQYTDAQASISGGTELVQYLINGGYHRETTVYPGDFGNKRGSLHFSLNTASVNKKFKTSLAGNFVSSYNYLPASDLWADVKSYPVAPPIYDANGNYNWQNNTFNNPFAQRLLISSKIRTKNIVGNAALSYEILPGLEVKTTLGYTDISMNDLQAAPSTASRPNLNLAPASTFGFNSQKSWIIEPQVKYRFNISDGRFDVLVGSTIQEHTTDGFAINAAGYVDNSLLENLAGAGSISKANVYYTKYRYNAGFARITYNWQDKYIVNLTARRDGSSRFGPENQFNNFGAAGAAWLFSNEDFVRNSVPFLSFGKIRASYGTTGSDQTSDYRFLETYGYLTANVANSYQGVPAVTPSSLFNPELAWEVNKKAEVGLEIGLDRDRYFFTASVFRNRSSNQLMAAPLPDMTGFNQIPINLPALVENKGLELLVRTHNVNTKDFTWVSTINFTKQTNKLLEYPELDLSPTHKALLVVGQSLSVKRLYNYVGVDPTKGLYTFRKANGVDTTRPIVSGNEDRTVMLNVDPEFFGGFQNTFTYKNFELDIFIQGVKQMGLNPLFMTNNIAPGTFSRFTPLSWSEEIMNNRWQKVGDVASVQKFTRNNTEANDAYTAVQGSQYAYVDASFIRLKSASFSYRLPDAFVRRMNLDRVRVYVQGQNLLTFTNYKGVDPENAANAILYMPPLRVITGGIQVTL